MCGGWGVPEDDELSPDEGGCGKKKAIGAGIDKSKRGFTTAAMASPVLMSLLSKPAWSATACSISGLTSGNVSSPDGAPGPCSGDGMGCTPGIWKSQPNAWALATGFAYSPGKCVSWDHKGSCKEWSTEGATSFFDAFDFVIPGGDEDNTGTPTMMDLLMLADKPGAPINHAWQAHWIAALLNATASPSYGSSPEDIIAAVRGVAGGGTWEINGQFIDAAQLHDVLEKMNERDCLFNANGFCDEHFLKNVDGDCIPSCRGNQKFDVNTAACVDDNDWKSGSADTAGHCSIEDALNGEPWCDTSLINP